MSAALAKQTENGALAQAGQWDAERMELVRRTLCPEAQNLELELFAEVCRRTALDPFARQIYLIVRGQGDRRKATIQTGIDGFRLIADRTGCYAGSDDPVFRGELQAGKDVYPETATVTVWKLVQGQRCPFAATARWREYYPGDAQGAMWRKMPYTMLGKCAEALALRKAFPQDLSGLYIREEMEQADTLPTATGGRVNPQTGEVIDAGTRVGRAVRTAETEPSYAAATVEHDGEPEELRRARTAYFAQLKQILPEATKEDELRHCVEALLLKRTEPVRDKSNWGVNHWLALKDRLLRWPAEDRQELLEGARAMRQSVQNQRELAQAADPMHLGVLEAEVISDGGGDLFAQEG